VQDNSLCILDKLFLSYADLYQVSGQQGGNRHWIVPAKSNLIFKKVRCLGNKNDELVQVQLGAKARSENPQLPESMVVRAIRYRIKGFRPRTLLTTLLDPQAYPADEITALYHERWELELGYDEIKTHMLEREEALRSQKPEGVK
jgi:IS4 transposase